ncbi:MAG: hypothetical protein STSR0008_17170 [Ignavibacterium sp.]
MKHRITIYKKISLFCFIITLMTSLFLNSCDSPNDPTFKQEEENADSTVTSNLVSIKGKIVDAVSGIGIDSTIIRFYYQIDQQFIQTDFSGNFSVQFNLDTTRVVTLIITKFGYQSDTTSLTVKPGSEIIIDPIQLIRTRATSGKSGPPSSIYLVSQTTTNLGVKESGALEVGKIVFQVVDSVGMSIDFNNSSLVKFRFGGRPNGGEFLSPDFVYTDSSGQASVNLTSGTKAGVVQILAEIEVGNKTITSKPVNYTIHGGLPDINHFSVAPQFLNFAGYNVYGLLDGITAFVGDKYGNPVRPQTSVYFTTDGGIIGGSAETDEMGTATVSLLSADPKPFHTNLGAGFSTITASTINEFEQTISTQCIVLFSGVPFISIFPTTFDLPDEGSLTFNYQVQDQNGNPLASGTSISVKVEGENVESKGDLNINLPDTQSKTWTHFSFFITDKDTVNKSRPVYITIETTGPNGGDKLSISGTAK